MKPTKCPAREKKGQKNEKREGGGEEKRKANVKTAVSLSNPARARTSQADILHLDQKVVKYTALWYVLALYSTTMTRKPLY